MQLNLFDSEIYINRRNQLKQNFQKGIILLLGNTDSPRNFADNTFPFRQDSHFLYYFGIDLPGLVAVIDIESGDETIFGDELTIDDVVWTGPQPSISELSKMVGIRKTCTKNDIFATIGKYKNTDTKIHYLPPYRTTNKVLLQHILQLTSEECTKQVSIPLIKAIAKQRTIKEDIELVEIESAVNVTSQMHRAAMIFAKEGLKEYEVAAKVAYEAAKMGQDLAFNTILTTRGETLHNHYLGNTLKAGDMVLCDCGSESPMKYAGDMTRTFPVGKTFSQKQKEIYDIVLSAHELSISMLKPNVAYKDIYLAASKHIFSELKTLGITKGDPEEAIAEGAHAMFFQCGLGHLMGLDVHDMEDLGEQYVGYTDQIIKSTQFGMKSLRLGKELEAGMVLTVEPGIYFIPTLIDLWKSQNKFSAFIDYATLNTYKDFGGIRIEDDFVITPSGSRLLGEPLARTTTEIEAIRSE